MTDAYPVLKGRKLGSARGIATIKAKAADRSLWLERQITYAMQAGARTMADMADAINASDKTARVNKMAISRFFARRDETAEAMWNRVTMPPVTEKLGWPEDVLQRADDEVAAMMAKDDRNGVWVTAEQHRPDYGDDCRMMGVNTATGQPDYVTVRVRACQGSRCTVSWFSAVEKRELQADIPATMVEVYRWKLSTDERLALIRNIRARHLREDNRLTVPPSVLKMRNELK